MIESLNFAMDFPADKDLIINLMRIADGEEREKELVNEYAGMPGGKSTGKLEPHLNYAQAMGLLEFTKSKGNFTITKTKLGEKVEEEDFSLTEGLTLEVINYNLSSNTIGTLGWNILIRKILSAKSTSIETIYNLFETKYEKDEKAARKIITPFKSMQNGFFQELNFLDTSSQNEMKIKGCRINKKHVYMYAYTLFSDWDVLFSNAPEITFADINEILQWGQGFGWNEEETFKALQLCEEYGLLKINKQLVPMTVVRNASTEDALRKLYDLL